MIKMFDTSFTEFDIELTEEALDELEHGKEETDDDVQPVNIVPKDI